MRIKEAEELWALLIYKNERAMSFGKFFTNMKRMFTGFSENGDIFKESQKV